MIMPLIWKEKLIKILRWSERYTKTDMVYIVSGNFWLVLSRVISVGGGLILTYVFANFLAPETFGKYKYVISIAGFIGAFSLTGLNPAITRAVAQGKEHVIRGVFRIGVLWSLPASIITLASAAYYFLRGNSELGIGLVLIAVVHPFLNNLVFTKSILIGKKDFRGMAYYGAVRGLIPVIILIAVVIMTQNLVWILIAYFLSNLVMSWIGFEQVMKKFGIQSKEEDVKETVEYGKHLSVMGGISQIIGNLDQLLMWHFAGPLQIAIYSFALAPIREIRNFPENIHPLLFSKFANKSVAELKATLPLRMFQLFGVSTLLAIAYILAAPLLFKILFPQYLSSVFISQIFALSLILQPKNIIESALYIQGATKLRYITTLTTSGSKAVFWILLIPTYGIWGAIAGTIASECVSALILFWAYKKLA